MKHLFTTVFNVQITGFTCWGLNCDVIAQCDSLLAYTQMQLQKLRWSHLSSLTSFISSLLFACIGGSVSHFQKGNQSCIMGLIVFLLNLFLGQQNTSEENCNGTWQQHLQMQLAAAKLHWAPWPCLPIQKRDLLDLFSLLPYWRLGPQTLEIQLQ